MEIPAVCFVVDAEGGVEDLADGDFGPDVAVEEAVEIRVSYVLISLIQMALLLIYALLIYLCVILELIGSILIEVLQQLVIALLRNNLGVLVQLGRANVHYLRNINEPVRFGSI